MADWSKPLPDEAVEGADTHVEDHNKLTAAIEEARKAVDANEATADAAKATADAAAPADHGHEVTDVDGLQDALDGKQAKGDFATAKALADVVERVKALEDARDDEGDGEG